MPGFVVCEPSQAVSASVAPCTDMGGVYHVPVVLEMPVPGTVTFENAELLFAYGFSAILMFWALGVGVGALLSLISKGR